MKKIQNLLALLMALMLVFSLAACGEGTDATDGQSTPAASEGESQGNEPDASKPEDPDNTETEPSQTQPDEEEFLYTVRVVDVDGQPVGGVFVQICVGSSCYPAQTDDDGIAGYATELAGDGELVAKLMVTTLKGYAPVDGVEEISMAGGDTDVVFVVEKTA